MVLRQTTAERELKFDIGDPQAAQPVVDPAAPPPAGPPAGGGNTIQFSEDGKWAAFTTYPTRTEAQRLRRQRRPVESGVDDCEPRERRKARLHAHPALRVLRRRSDVDRAASAAQLVRQVRRVRQAGQVGQVRAGGAGGERADAPKGTDLILRELATGNELNVGNVSDFAFTRDGRYLALDHRRARQGRQRRPTSQHAIGHRRCSRQRRGDATSG